MTHRSYLLIIRAAVICTAFVNTAAFVTTTAFGEGLFHPPRKILADGRPIDVKRSGHSAPFVGDFDGDGFDDLLVGEFHQGRLRIYRNTGNSQKPKYASFEWFSGKVPTG